MPTGLSPPSARRSRSTRASGKRRSSLADLHRARGEEAFAQEVLRDALGRDPSSAALHHALGLALVRQKRMPEAVASLSRAAALAPGDAHYAYVNAVALNDSGRKSEALRALDAGLARNPDDRQLLFTAATFRVQAGAKSPTPSPAA